MTAADLAPSVAGPALVKRIETDGPLKISTNLGILLTSGRLLRTDLGTASERTT